MTIERIRKAEAAIGGVGSESTELLGLFELERDARIAAEERALAIEKITARLLQFMKETSQDLLVEINNAENVRAEFAKAWAAYYRAWAEREEAR